MIILPIPMMTSHKIQHEKSRVKFQERALENQMDQIALQKLRIDLVSVRRELERKKKMREKIK